MLPIILIAAGGYFLRSGMKPALSAFKEGGRLSNLTPEQQKIVQTPAFKEWFGNSKVIDENGEPLLLYRGQQQDLGYKFELGKNLLGKKNANNFGYFFTPDIKTAQSYTESSIYGEMLSGKVLSVFVKAENILDLREVGLKLIGQDFIKLLEKKSVFFIGYEKLKEQISKYERTIDPIDNTSYTPNIYDFFDEFAALRNVFISNGIDMVIFKEMSRSSSEELTYVAFESNQIKLADGTNTTFNANNPDGGDIAYHGSPIIKEKGELTPSKSGELGAGVYFTRNKTLAEDYSRPRGEVKNMAEAVKKAGVAKLSLSGLKIKKITKDEYLEKRSDLYDAEQKLNDGKWDLGVAVRAEEKLIKQYEKEGYDGLEVEDEQQGVIFPSSVVKIKFNFNQGGITPYYNDRETTWMWISPDNQVYKVPKLKHQNFIMSRYKDEWDYDIVFEKAMNDGWVRGIYEYFPDRYKGELSLNGYDKDRVVFVLREIFSDLLKYGFKGVYIEYEYPKHESKAFSTWDSSTKQDLMRFMYPEKFEDGGEVYDDLYKKWKHLVNMSKGELQKFYDSKEGKEAGLSRSEAHRLGIHSGRQSARWIIKMKETPKSEWTPEMWSWADWQISFISRMKGNKGSLYDDKGNKTRKYTSLLIWGHNPEKFEDGGEVNQYLYHGTSAGALSRIITEGLKVGNDGVLNLSSNEQYARSYADRKGGSRGVMLRVEKDSDMEIDNRVVNNAKGSDYKTKKTIPIDKIEIKVGKKWIPLKDYDFYAFGKGGDVPTEFWGSVGAGVLIICKSTGRILLNYRSAWVMQPNTWNLYGGKLDDEEILIGGINDDTIIFQNAAKREVKEETGYKGKMELIDSHVFQVPDFTYYNFIGLVDKEFKVNTPEEHQWESEGHKWCTLKEFLAIKPKHFGLKELIEKDLTTIKKYAN